MLAGNLAFPLLLVGGLFLLSRRSQGGMGGGPGGNNAMNLGKSQAKFQMEPNTGINFDDVAGVEEAKNDFMEVQPLAEALASCQAGCGVDTAPCFSCCFHATESQDVLTG